MFYCAIIAQRYCRLNIRGTNNEDGLNRLCVSIAGEVLRTTNTRLLKKQFRRRIQQNFSFFTNLRGENRHMIDSQNSSTIFKSNCRQPFNPLCHEFLHQTGFFFKLSIREFFGSLITNQETECFNSY